MRSLLPRRSQLVVAWGQLRVGWDRLRVGWGSDCDLNLGPVPFHGPRLVPKPCQNDHLLSTPLPQLGTVDAAQPPLSARIPQKNGRSPAHIVFTILVHLKTDMLCHYALANHAQRFHPGAPGHPAGHFFVFCAPVLRPAATESEIVPSGRGCDAPFPPSASGAHWGCCWAMCLPGQTRVPTLSECLFSFAAVVWPGVL